MGKNQLVLILVSAICGSSLGFFPFIDISTKIQPFFYLTDLQLDQFSSDIAESFGLTTYKPLTQASLNTFAQRITDSALNITTSKTPPTLSDIARFFSNAQKAISNAGTCGLCQLGIALLQLDATFLPIILEILCDLYILLSTQSVSNFCSGIIDINLPILKFVRQNSQILDPQLACSILFQTNQCRFAKPALSWTSNVSTAPKIIPNVVADDSLTPLVFLHFSDFHISMNYKEGSVVDCGYPLCCLDGLGNSLRNPKAGRWGDYQCDVAPSMYTSTLKHISENFKNIAGIIYTGDIVDHTVWNTTKESNIATLRFAYKSLLQFFPGIPIYPVLGNHETQPTNVFPPTDDKSVQAAGLDQQWLYNEIIDLWKPWLSATALESLQKYGYYAQNYSSSLKIIGLNNNQCYILNWWLWYDTNYLIPQLNWLNNQLEESERNGQRVYIVGHNSMGDGECIEPWERSYGKIIERFSHIIMGQFSGHTHHDEMKIFYDSYNNPINIAWNGASLTTFQSFNPNFKLMYIRPDTWEILDISTYIFNMTQANLNPFQDPSWFKLYSMKSEYNMSNLSPKSVDEFCDKMAYDKNLRNQYWLNYVRRGDAALKTGCDDNCQHDIHCKIPQTQVFKQIKSYCN